MLIVRSSITDVYRNLAIEEVLLDQKREYGPVLFLWQSDCAVVIGKNQNPWQECRLDLMECERVPLARRISGGGTVYHDGGNLNYCVIIDRTQYREDPVYEIVFRTLGKFGIRAEKLGKNSLCVDGRKFSGNAFCFRKNRVLHHGTLLVETDLERMMRYLKPIFNRISSRAIPSVPAAVMNLREAAEISVENLAEELTRVFCRLFYDGSELIQWMETDIDEKLLDPLVKKQLSNEWKFCATPKFDVTCGDMHLRVERGMIMPNDSARSVMLAGKAFHEVAFSLLC